MKNVVIAGYARSPFTPAKKGELARVRPDECAAQVVKAVVERTGVKVEELEDVILGCAFPEGEQGLNVARLVGFLAGLPNSTAGATVNRFCGSSMQAIHMAAGAIRMGAGEAFLCGGVESMTRVPMPGFNVMPHPGLCESYPEAYISMGETAENLAGKYAIPRERQEALALASHRQGQQPPRQAGKFRRGNRRHRARQNLSGRKARRLHPAPTQARSRPCPSLAAGLQDKEGSVTAGTSSPLTDGASAVLVTSEDYAQAHGLAALARIREHRRGRLRAGDHGHRPRRRRPARRSSAPGRRRGGGPRHRSSSTRPSPCPGPGLRRTISASTLDKTEHRTAAPSPSAIPSAPPARASPARPRQLLKNDDSQGPGARHPCASAAARASPRCWRRREWARSDTGRRPRRRRHGGAASPPTWPMPACPVTAPRRRARGRPGRAQRPGGKGALARMLKSEPAPWRP